MVWTTPLVATLGMSLTIPLAMIADMVIHGRHFSAVYIFGCIQVAYISLSVKKNKKKPSISLTTNFLTCVFFHCCRMQVFAGFVIANMSDKFSAKSE